MHNVVCWTAWFPASRAAAEFTIIGLGDRRHTQKMDLFASYADSTDDERELSPSAASSSPLPPTSSTRGPGRTGGREIVKKRAESVTNSRQPKAKKSRWAQSSAFLAPVAYDREDVEDGADDEEEEEERAWRAARPQAGVGSALDVARLKRLLPAPVNERRDKNVPGTSAAKSVPEKPALMPVSTEPMAPTAPTASTVRTSPGNSRKMFAPRINAAPDVGGSRTQTNRPNAYPNPPEEVALPANAIIKEISGAELRGPPGPGSSQDLELKFRAEAARSSAIPKGAKRKNQLSALLADAKATADEHREKRAGGAHLRNATRGKYGW